ncbi:MAG TPA: hypothetical protein PKA66_11905 [Gemmatimonadales bacterium]|nr:hypothetical protein [Gemmatimonadales bacterium]
MARFLIEVPHDDTAQACIRAIEAFHRTGSHFLTHADWGCQDGDHRAWVIVEVGTHEEASNVIPPTLRPQAKVVKLNAFTPQDLEQLRREYGS